MTHILLNRRRFLAGMAVLALNAASAGGALAAPEPTAAAFLASLYDRYRNAGPGVDISDAKALRRWFTPELATRIQRDSDAAAKIGEVPALSADPFIDAQDGEITKIVVKVDQASADKATGRVAITNSGETKTIVLSLLRTKAGWRIDDIKWPEGTLRGLYAQ